MQGKLLRPLGLSVIAAVAALILSACGGGGGAVTRVDATAFADTIATPGTVVLDVRTPDEFASGHIEGAVNIDVEGGAFEAGIADLDRNATYAVYCRSGNRSQVAVAMMEDAGFTSIVELESGIGGWVGAGYPITTA